MFKDLRNKITMAQLRFGIRHPIMGFFVDVVSIYPKTATSIILGMSLLFTGAVNEIVQKSTLNGKIQDAIRQSTNNKPIYVDLNGAQYPVTVSKVHTDIQKDTEYTSGQKSKVVEKSKCEVTAYVGGPIRVMKFDIGNRQVTVALPLRSGPCQ